MLLPAKDCDPDTRTTMLLRDILAYDRETGAFLVVSRGRSRYAPKYYLFFGDAYAHPVVGVNGDFRPYREWRTSFRSWSFEEALDIANKKLARLKADGRAHVSAICSVFYR
jgi:hypothetical protein